MPDHVKFLAMVKRKFGPKVEEICSELLRRPSELGEKQPALSEIEALAVARTRANQEKLVTSIQMAHEPFTSQ
jgi:hypothetical protein